MKKHISILLTGILAAALLVGCGSQDSELVSKTPFPEFDEVDTQGNAISSDIFAYYGATVINFWSNGCGTCIEEMPELEELYHQLQKDFMVDFDDTGSIGKRYRRQDEIGTPLCITVDFQTVGDETAPADHCVTVRDRDTMEQVRLPIENLKAYLTEKTAF